MTSRPTRAAVVLAGLLATAPLAAAVPAHAAAITDPVGDFLGSYVGPRNADLDVVATSGDFLGDHYTFTGTFAGAVGSTPGGVYVFGLDRGQGTARFAAIGSAVVFDSVVVVMPGSPTTVRDLISGAAPTSLAAGATTITGSSLQVDVPASLLPTEGFAAASYTYNLWPRSGLGNNNQIADFAPDNSNLSVGALAVGVPEPASMAVLGMGLLGALGLRRRGTRAA